MAGWYRSTNESTYFPNAGADANAHLTHRTPHTNANRSYSNTYEGPHGR